MSGERETVWRTATWAAPFVAQVVLLTALSASWVLGRSPFFVHGFVQYAIAAVATLLLSAVLIGALSMSSSSRARGLAVAVAGSCVVVAVGVGVYGFWILGW